MGRTSRRDTIYNVNKETKVNTCRAGIYTRLSKERNEEWRNKSCSMESQIEICQEYLNKENINLIKVYTDYEYSGANFDRPGYQEMMSDVRDGIINCIIIRDLSRLGREHLEMGRLVDKVFPFLGVRFISVVDKIDTEHGVDAKLSFEMLIKNLINDMYVKDISQKVKSSKFTKAKSGYFIGSNPPFGYKIVKKDGGRKLEPDEKSSKVIRKIFELFSDGMNAHAIAKYLNEKNISTSVAYYKTGNIEREPGEPQWRKGTISNMLRNKVYIGHLIQGTKYTPTGKKKCHYEIKSKDEWIVVENAHEPLISEELFNKVQEIMNANRNKNLFKVTKNIKRDPVNRYKGIIYDGNTGLSLLRMPTSNRRNNPNCYYYRFTNKSYDGQFLETPCITVLEQDLDEMVKAKIESSLSVNVNGKNTKAKIIEAANIKIEVINRNINSISFKIEKLDSDFKKIYEQYSLGVISKDEYLEKRDRIKSAVSSYEKEISSLEIESVNINKKAEKDVKLFEDLMKGKGKRITGEVIREYVKRIDFYDDETVKITLKESLEKGEDGDE